MDNDPDCHVKSKDSDLVLYGNRFAIKKLEIKIREIRDVGGPSGLFYYQMDGNLARNDEHQIAYLYLRMNRWTNESIAQAESQMKDILSLLFHIKILIF